MAGHLRIGQGAEIGGQAGIISDVVPGAKVLGSPVQPKSDSCRQTATLKKMTKRGLIRLVCKMSMGSIALANWARSHLAQIANPQIRSRAISEQAGTASLRVPARGWEDRWVSDPTDRAGPISR